MSGQPITFSRGAPDEVGCSKQPTLVKKALEPGKEVTRPSRDNKIYLLILALKEGKCENYSQATLGS